MIAYVLLGLAIVIVAGVVMVDYYAQHQPAPHVSPSYPADLAQHGPLCLGHYDDGVSVSWPAVNGLC